MSAKSRRFIPRLEAFDDRIVPAVDVQLVGSTLIITGNGDANSIAITDYGPIYDESGYQGDIISVVADGETHTITGRVSAIAVQTFEGDDTVTYDLQGALSVTRLISVELGRGADVFTGNLHGNTVTGEFTRVGFTVDGQGGGDTLTLNADGVIVDPGARLDATFSGSGGRDAITFSTVGLVSDGTNVSLTKDQRR